MPKPLEPPSDLVASSMQDVDQLIRKRLASDVVLINQVAGYIIGSGGKRLRPQLVLLSAGACGLPLPELTRAASADVALATSATDNNVIMLAAIVEFIHTATLLHDDVVDASELRRGTNTANSVWGNEAAVLVGDFLYSRAFEMIVDVNNMAVMGILASTTNRIAEGEVMQLLHIREPDITEEQYIHVIEAKTACLFSAAGELGAICAEQTQYQPSLADYGMHLGTAFQITDDVLDYRSQSDEMGKNVGDDLAEGKTTLPLIYAMQQASSDKREVIATAIREAELKSLPQVLSIVSETNAIEQSIARANVAVQQATEALSGLPASPCKDALVSIAKYAVQRTS
ncbi:MAG: polyprenyl synthetase family protein [Granulosicoccaceae bacterium]